MAEEHRCQAPPEGPPLCANNCGFFGSPAMQGLCSKCYRDQRLKEDQEASARIAVGKSLQTSSSSCSTPAGPRLPPSNGAGGVPPPLSLDPVEPRSSPTAAVAASPAPSPSPPSGRCTTCRKRVGLTGFRCRCGESFCSSHRYPEQHGCTYDFKAAGRDAIARANPLVKADKLDKI